MIFIAFGFIIICGISGTVLGLMASSSVRGNSKQVKAILKKESQGN